MSPQDRHLAKESGKEGGDVVNKGIDDRVTIPRGRKIHPGYLTWKFQKDKNEQIIQNLERKMRFVA